MRLVPAWEEDSSLRVLSHGKMSIEMLRDRDLCDCLARSRLSTGDRRIAQLDEVLVQEQDGYGPGFKTQEGNSCVPTEPNPNQGNLQ